MGSLNFLRVHKFPISSHDIEVMLVDADRHLVMSPGVDEIDPDPFFSLFCLHDL
jgi:hypothetical protein